MTATLFSEIEEVCPGGDALLGQLYHASTHRLPIPLMQIPDGVKSELALFCYRRGHLREIGLAIAAACDEADLVRVGVLSGAYSSLVLRTRPGTLQHCPPHESLGLSLAPSRMPTIHLLIPAQLGIERFEGPTMSQRKVGRRPRSSKPVDSVCTVDMRSPRRQPDQQKHRQAYRASPPVYWAGQQCHQ